MPGSAVCKAGVEATMTESPTAVTAWPDTCCALGDGVAAGLELARAAGTERVARRCRRLCRCRLTGGGISFACRAPPSDAACALSVTVDADAKSLRLPARQSAIVTARVLLRMTAARRRGRPGVRGSRGLLCFAIRNVCCDPLSNPAPAPHITRPASA